MGCFLVVDGAVVVARVVLVGARVVVVGLATTTCVESTGRYAVEMGYHTTFLKDAVATFSHAEQKAAIELDYPRIAHAVRTVDEFLGLIE